MLDKEDIGHILELVLHEFPVAEIALHLPEWTRALDGEHPIRRSLLQTVRRCADRVNKIGDVREAFADLGENEYIKSAEINSIAKVSTNPSRDPIITRSLSGSSTERVG